MKVATFCFRFLLAVALVGIVQGCGASQQLPSASTAPSEAQAQWLYVMSASSGTVDPFVADGASSSASAHNPTHTLTLTSPQSFVIKFTDRPARDHATMSLKAFLSFWDQGSDSFLIDPPNAALEYVDGQGSPAISVVELYQPELSPDGKTLRFAMKEIAPAGGLSHYSGDTKPLLATTHSFSNPVLFIDTSSGSAGVSAAFTQIYDSNSGTINTKSTPYSDFDVLYVGFAHINQQTYKLDFEDVSDGGVTGESQRLQNILTLTKARREAGQLKVVISLGYGSAFNDIPLIEQHLDVFAPSVAAFVQANGLDGFDIDYEGPTFSSNADFQDVSKAIRTALGFSSLFTITPNTTTSLDGATLNTYFDYINVQSYQYSGDARCPVTNFTSMTGLSSSKILAGADIANGDNIQTAIDAYQQYGLGGVFAWQLTADFGSTADEMWNATHPLGSPQV